MFELYYKKYDNSLLFKDFDSIGIQQIQNYVPIYKRFFSLKQSNYKNLNLNHKFHLIRIESTEKKNIFDCIIGSDNQTSKKSCFFKFSPLLDPIKYLVGKYDSLGEKERMSLPELDENICHAKVLDVNNTAYVDSFFSYLISKTFNTFYFPHGLDFFGSFLGVQKEFTFNIADDLEYLHDSTFFHKNQDVKFKVNDINMGILTDFDTRNYKKKINIGNKISNENVISINSVDFKDVFHLSDITDSLQQNVDLIYEFDLPTNQSRKTDSTCSSRSSNTEKSSIENDEEEESENSDEISSVDFESMDSDIEIASIIYNFPVQIICLECLDNTLDSLLNEENEMDSDEWRACLFQIIMMLIIYQKMFDFTHNDLHTNNIMFQKTEKQYLCYRYNQKYYKVPTYGKIFKIIDFGRAIYKYKGKRICSDSYHSKGDAATQYNCEPFFNDKKPRLEPNPSFDLCRLGCSLFDYFIDDIDNIDPLDSMSKLIIEWTKDDKGRNILYKKNGEERYPDFKLYKMIARTVTKTTPQAQLVGPFFNRFVVTRKKINRISKLVDVDKMPVLSEII
jgi:hypothetical protein